MFNDAHGMQIGLHSTDDSNSDEELVWRDADWKTIPYREYPWTLSAMQVSPLPCASLGLSADAAP